MIPGSERFKQSGPVVYWWWTELVKLDGFGVSEGYG